MAVTVQIPTPLRKLIDNKAEVDIQAGTIGELVEVLEEAHRGIKEKLLDENGEIRRYVNVYLNDEDIRFLDGADTLLSEGDKVAIVPAIAGGRSLS